MEQACNQEFWSRILVETLKLIELIKHYTTEVSLLLKLCFREYCFDTRGRQTFHLHNTTQHNTTQQNFESFKFSEVLQILGNIQVWGSFRFRRSFRFSKSFRKVCAIYTFYRVNDFKLKILVS